MEIKTEIAKKSYLSFRLGDEIFAISVHKVLEVLEYQKITKVPKTPDYIKGVINFRGEILPVISTRVKFNMPYIEETIKTVIIVLELETRGKIIVLGAVADSVKDVIEISGDQIKPVPELGSRYDTEFIQGMIKSEQGFIMLLNIDKVFSTDDISILKKTQEAVSIE
jgi:purine-binding chemotaxis protein CheW